LRNQEGAGLTVRWFLSICLIVVGFIVVFPATNFWFSLVAGGIKLSAMDSLKGVSIKTFTVVLVNLIGEAKTH
jgi:hypothetical protein